MPPAWLRFLTPAGCPGGSTGTSHGRHRQRFRRARGVGRGSLLWTTGTTRRSCLQVAPYCTPIPAPPSAPIDTRPASAFPNPAPDRLPRAIARNLSGRELWAPETEEARSRPMAAGDPRSDGRQRLPGLAVELESVRAHQHRMHAPIPLPHEARAGLNLMARSCCTAEPPLAWASIDRRATADKPPSAVSCMARASARRSSESGTGGTGVSNVSVHKQRSCAA